MADTYVVEKKNMQVQIGKDCELKDGATYRTLTSFFLLIRLIRLIGTLIRLIKLIGVPILILVPNLSSTINHHVLTIA